MDILQAIEANKTQRVAFVDAQGKIKQSFKVGALTHAQVVSGKLLKGSFIVLPEDVIYVVDGTTKVINEKAKIPAGSVFKTYKLVKE